MTNETTMRARTIKAHYFSGEEVADGVSQYILPLSVVATLTRGETVVLHSRDAGTDARQDRIYLGSMPGSFVPAGKRTPHTLARFYSRSRAEYIRDKRRHGGTTFITRSFTHDDAGNPREGEAPTLPHRIAWPEWAQPID